ncbi:hypothetical protein GCM10027184_51950 [Saccharothrix stipae]
MCVFGIPLANSAHQRDLDALTNAQDRTERLAAEHHHLTRRIDGLRNEVELRDRQPAQVRERERPERHTELVCTGKYGNIRTGLRTLTGTPTAGGVRLSSERVRTVG